MKICAIISEYNPFHNGHKYLIEQAKEKSGADCVLCIMSGNFTQRGEIAVMDKYTRSKHAVLSGADCVIELPAVFSTASAEFFARGAIKILSEIPDVHTLAFGCENDDAALIQNTAELIANEPKSFKKSIKEKLKSGISFVKARNETLSEINGVDSSVLSSPNNILALEYSKAIAYYSADIRLLPIKRIGADHNDRNLKQAYSSASSIRENFSLRDSRTVKTLKSVMPEYVFNDLKNVQNNNFKELALYSMMLHSADELKGILDCTEGLENRFKALLKDTHSYDELINKMTSKRYTSSRLRRIMLASFLNINKKFICDCLDGDLYIKVLAVNKDKSEEILSSLSSSCLPVITRKKDCENLKKIALACFEKDSFANDLYNFTAKIKTNQYYTLFV